MQPQPSPMIRVRLRYKHAISAEGGKTNLVSRRNLQRGKPRKYATSTKRNKLSKGQLTGATCS